MTAIDSLLKSSMYRSMISIHSNVSEILRRELPRLRGFSEASLKKMRSFYEEWQMIDGNSFVATNELESADSKII